MDRSLFEHIKIDLGWFPRSMQMVDLLLERNGYVPSIEKISNRVQSQVNKPHIQEKGYQTIPLRGTWIGMNCNVCIVRRKLFGVSENNIGEVQLGKASVDSQNRLSNFEVLYFINEDRKLDDYSFSNTLRHELTHAYEFLQRSLRAQKLGQQIPRNTKLNKLVDQDVKSETLSDLRREVQKASGFRKTNLNRLCKVLYLVLPTEQNAFIAQIRSELSQKASTLSDPRKATEAVEATEAWHNLVIARQSLDKIKQLKKEENKADILKYCIEYFGNVRNFSRAISTLEYNLDSFERKLKSRVGKVCGELYQNSEEWQNKLREATDRSHPYLFDAEDEDIEEW